MLHAQRYKEIISECKSTASRKSCFEKETVNELTSMLNDRVVLFFLSLRHNAEYLQVKGGRVYFRLPYVGMAEEKQFVAGQERGGEAGSMEPSFSFTPFGLQVCWLVPLSPKVGFLII